MSNPNHNRRKRLSLLAAVALLVVGLGATFAATSDSASSGKLEVESADVASGIDIRITDVAVPDNGHCITDVTDGDYAQNQTIDLNVQTDATPSDGQQFKSACLKNFGSEAATFDLTTIENVTDTEQGCTFDEVLDDPDCGSSATGDLNGLVHAEIIYESGDHSECWAPGDSTESVNEYGQSDGDAVDGPIADGTTLTPDSTVTLNPNDILCLTTGVDYDASPGGITPAQEAAAQSDTLSWTLRFDFSQV